MTLGCQHGACDALAEAKVREVRTDTGEIVWWRHLCAAHLEKEYEPWLKTMTGWRERLWAA